MWQKILLYPCHFHDCVLTANTVHRVENILYSVHTENKRVQNLRIPCPIQQNLRGDLQAGPHRRIKVPVPRDKEKDKDGRDGKGHHCCLRDRIPCRASYFAPVRIGWIAPGQLKNRLKCTRTIWEILWINPFLQIILVKNSYRCKEFCPPNSSDDLWQLFSIYPSSMVSVKCVNQTPLRF